MSFDPNGFSRKNLKKYILDQKELRFFILEIGNAKYVELNMFVFRVMVKKFFGSFFQKIKFFLSNTFFRKGTGKIMPGFYFYNMEHGLFPCNDVNLEFQISPITMKYLKIILSQKFKGQCFAFFTKVIVLGHTVNYKTWRKIC